MDRLSLGQAAIEAELTRLQQHAHLRKSPKLAQLLAYLVRESLAGRGKRLKAYTIATEALGRPDDFDPVTDSIVRVEIRRLRATLQRIYAGPEPRQVVVELPVGCYEPVFRQPPSQNQTGPAGAPDEFLAAALRESEERYAALVKASAVIEWRAEPDGHLTQSLGWSERTGQEEDLYRGTGWLGALHPEDRERVSQSWTTRCRAGAAFELSFRVRQQDGRYQAMLARAVPLERPDGTCRGWVGTIVDHPPTPERQADAEPGAIREALDLKAEFAGRIRDVAHSAILETDQRQALRTGVLIALSTQLRDAGVILGHADARSPQVQEQKPTRSAANC
ncbi:PAS domain-containing protein [Methylobacterium komagatae]|uniref:histidine kinase n=1 Tax=Methylobacterium komagatae TaxID=374425 RepID=A0ABW2BR86_9HYPH